MKDLNTIMAITSQALEVPQTLICESTDLHTDLQIDSIDLMMLIVKLEDTYGTELSPEQVKEVETIADLVYLFSENFAVV